MLDSGGWEMETEGRQDVSKEMLKRNTDAGERRAGRLKHKLQKPWREERHIWLCKILELLHTMKVKVPQSCPTLCYPMDCSPQSSSVHGILQARILERIAIFFFQGSSWTQELKSPALLADSLLSEPEGSTPWILFNSKQNICGKLATYITRLE